MIGVWWQVEGPFKWLDFNGVIEPHAGHPGQVDWRGLPGGGVGDHGGAEVGAFDDSSYGARDTRPGGGMWGHARSKVGGMPGRWTGR